VSIQWLGAYAYRINMDWWLFGVAGVLALLIAIYATSFRSVKTALMREEFEERVIMMTRKCVSHSMK